MNPNSKSESGENGTDKMIHQAIVLVDLIENWTPSALGSRILLGDEVEDRITQGMAVAMLVRSHLNKALSTFTDPRLKQEAWHHVYEARVFAGALQFILPNAVKDSGLTAQFTRAHNLISELDGFLDGILNVMDTQ